MRVSVVINTYNRMRSLPIALSALTYLRYPDIEVVVVDGPSDDGTLSFLESLWADRIKICQCAEANLSKSRNIGIKNATGDIICFTDDDGIPEPDWLDRLIAAYANQNVGAAGGWVRNHTGVDYQTKYIVSSRSSSSEVLVETPEDVPATERHAEKFPGLIGVNSSFRRAALIEVGGFDEEYAYFLDETDVLVRMVDAGYHIAMVPDAEVHHKYAASHIRAQNGIARSWLQIMRSTAYFIVKNATPQTPLTESLALVGYHKQQLRNHTNWYCSTGLIDEARHTELMSEIEVGASQGITDAFEFPSRKLIAPHTPPPWKNFLRLPAKDRLRLAMVTTYYPPRPCGGVAMFMHTLATQLAELGHEITIITQAMPGNPHTVDFEDGVWIHRLPTEVDLPCTLPDDMPDMPESAKRYAGQVLAELDRVNPRRQFQSVIGSIWDLEIAAVIAAKRYHTAMYLVTSYKIMEDSKPEWRENPHFYINHVQKMINSEIWAIKNCSKVLASTKCILRDISNLYDIKVEKERVDVIPFGVPDLPQYDIISNDDSIRLLFVGRLEERKGIDTLLDALPEIMEKNPRVSIDIVGDNSIVGNGGITYKQEFYNKNSGNHWIERVFFHGHVDDSTLTLMYKNCDIFVAPSKYESFGLIYLEAMRFSKPCIGTRTGGIPEVVLNGKTGLLVPPDNVNRLKQAIYKLTDDRDMRELLGRAGRQRFLEKFTGEMFARRIIDHAKFWDLASYSA